MGFRFGGIYMLNRWINSIDDVVATVVLVGLIGVTSANVLFRFILESPFVWGEEISLALHVWLVFIGISSTMKRKGHVGIDYFVEKLPEKLRITAKIIRESIICIVLLYVLVYLGFKLTAHSSALTPVLRISSKWIILAVPIGGLLTFYHFIRTLAESFRNNPLKRGDV